MLNKIVLSNNCFFKLLLAFIVFALLINSSCGKRKPPQPPAEKIKQRVEINGFQQGNLIIIAWSLPVQNPIVNSTLNINRADIYRLTEPVKSTLTLSEEEFADRSTLIYSMNISDEDFRRKKIIFTDTLQFAGQPVRLRYAIRLVNASGQKAAFSNFLLIEPTAKIASNPVNLRAEISEDKIALNWQAPDKNVDGSMLVNILGFNVYRMNLSDGTAVILNNTPISDIKFTDHTFEFGTDYKYYIRAVSLGSDGQPVESLNSNTIEVKPRDIFAPSPPSGVTIAAAPNNLSIFFAINSEKDIIGYRVYRSLDRELPFSKWTLLTENLLTTNTFQDITVESGKKYFYFIQAVDKTGNVSEPSDIISETAH